MDSPLTISERFFEEFCRRASIRCERLIPDSKTKTPDYEIFLNDQPVIVEIKEIDRVKREPNGTYKLIVGDAARGAIREANRQIRAKTKGLAPGMVVLFEEEWMQVTPVNLRHAMYGEHTVDLHVPQDHRQSPRIIGHRMGGHRQMSPANNTSTSAVAILERERNGTLSLSVFHNRHTKQRIPTPCLAAYGIPQFILPKDYTGIPEWELVTEP